MQEAVSKRESNYTGESTTGSEYQRIIRYQRIIAE